MTGSIPPPSPLAYEGQVVVPSIQRNFPPQTTFNKFPVPTVWIDTVGLMGYIQVGKPLGVAHWISLGGSLLTLSDTINTTVSPSSITSTPPSNIQLIGQAGQINVVSNPGSNSITFSLAGGGGAIESFQMDAFTAPGTNPVLPSGAGLVTITGSQVAAGTTSNVIQTSSLAANTYTIEVQRSQAAAASTVGDNGVSHFNSSNFTVDANGFVSLIGGAAAISKVNVQTGTTPIVPSSGAVTFNGTTVASGTNPVRTDGTGANTVALEVQISQAIAATDATKIGLSAFNSSDFSVDANGFVSLSSGSLAYTNVNHAMSPYTVLVTDNYLSVDVSGGVVQLNFPNAPTANQRWVVKDRTGGSATSNITLTTPGGAVTFDGLTTYTMNSNYQAVNILANSTPTYEVY